MIPSVGWTAGRPSGPAAWLGLLAIAATLSGCAQTGDFGRKNPNVVNDRILPAMGDALARSRSEPVSPFRGTDNEQEMRDLAWAVVMPPLHEQYRGRVIAELRRTRILPADRLRLEKANYVRTLLAIDFRSSSARYARLIDDVVADTARVEPFFQSAARVDVDDRARRRTLETAPEVTPEERENALARIDENGLFIAWTRESFEERLVAYRYALDRLMIETPDPRADVALAALDAFAMVLKSLRPLGPQRGVFKG